MQRRRSDFGRGIMMLLFSIAVVFLFLIVIGPRLDRLSYVKPLATFIDERDIKANMYFYTEVEEFSEANINMENTMDYPPIAP